MSAVDNQRGAALVATLAIALVLLPVGAWMLMQTRGDFLVGRNLRSELETLFVADAGVAHALAQITADNSFDRLLGAKSGVSPFGGAAPAFPAPPFRYDVIVSPASSDTLRIVSAGYGRNGASKRVVALLKRDAAGHFDVRWCEDL